MIGYSEANMILTSNLITDNCSKNVNTKLFLGSNSKILVRIFGKNSNICSYSTEKQHQQKSN